jgi:hypothetical protein
MNYLIFIFAFLLLGSKMDLPYLKTTWLQLKQSEIVKTERINLSKLLIFCWNKSCNKQSTLLLHYKSIYWIKVIKHAILIAAAFIGTC